MSKILKLLIIGIIQGIAEVLPISSSAHIKIASEILNIKSDTSFEVFLHIASLFAIIIYLRKIIKKLLVGTIKYLFKKDMEEYLNFKYTIMIILSTIPLVIFTLILKAIGYEESSMFSVGLSLIINAIILYMFRKFNSSKNIEEITYRDSLIIGLFQMFGIFPGISRSGVTLVGTNVVKMDKKIAKEYTFMMLLPSVIGAFVLEFKNIVTINIYDKETLIAYILAFIITIITTYLSFVLLSKIISKQKIHYFSIYCLIIGILTLIYSINNKLF